MKTVKEISDLTGISARTLHYYDEIGLLPPTDKTEAGYRLYDDHALETLQQILFFREFDIPLKEIKRVMDDPALDKTQLWKAQRDMLVQKKQRLEDLISSIDGILCDGNAADFTIFKRSEIEELCQSTLERMSDFLRQSIVDEFGSLESWKDHYIERASEPDMQRCYQKQVEWYVQQEINNSPTAEVGQAYANRVQAIEDRLQQRRGFPIDSLETRLIIGEYSFVMKQFCQAKHEAPLMQAVASCYRDELGGRPVDEKFGAGTAQFIAEAIDAFYSEA